jgi:signal transduction histidine kinase
MSAHTGSAAHPGHAPLSPGTAPPAASALPARRLYAPAHVLRDLAYVLPGMVLSALAFSLLVPLTAAGIGTAVVWVGLLLLPLTLLLASAFAGLSRARLRAWGAEVPAPRYRPQRRGVRGVLGIMADPRRWLDLLFETLVAFPLRLVTFVLAVTWVGGALGGLTYWFWGLFLPHSDGDGALATLLLVDVSGLLAPADAGQRYLIDAIGNAVLGLVFLVSLPPVIRGCALLDALTTQAALSGGGHPGTGSTGTVPVGRRPVGEDPVGEGTTVPLPAGSALSPAPTGTAPEGAAAAASATGVSAEGWAWIAAGFSAAVLLAVGWPVTAAAYGVPVVFAMLLAGAHSAALLLAVRLPYPAAVLTAAAAGASALLSAPAPGQPWPWLVTSLLTASATVLVLAVRGPWHHAAAAWVLTQAAVLAAVMLAPALVPGGSAATGLTPGALAGLITGASVMAGAGLLGAGVRALLQSRGALAAERRTSAELDARQRDLAERNRIAQELHDVVAHSMSVISVQATTAPYRIEEMDERERSEFAAIADSSRRALTEMRGLLAVLRAADAEAPLAPQPTLADLPALVEATRASGAEIRFSAQPSAAAAGSVAEDDSAAGARLSPEALAQVGTATGLTVYRIVQESLSNAVRHAPGAPIAVSVSVGAETVIVDVSNEASPQAGPLTPAPGAGLGLRGIRERAQALGGIVEAGPAPDRGFRVHAVLPHT